MCNAWNHTKDCTCGFGGEGHLGGGWGGYHSIVSTDFINEIIEHSKQALRNEYDSFVIPNAICPVCGANVFFYQSPFGGRVFFDELQPPWPKHPCTNNSIVSQFQHLKTENIHRKKIKNKWSPVSLHKSYLRFFDDYIVIAGTINKRDSTEGFKECVIKNHEGLKYSNPLFYRKTSPHDFEISSFYLENDSVKEIVVEGWVREKAISLLPKSTHSLKISIGDKVDALFNGEVKGIYLKIELKNWTVQKNCFIDKINLSTKFKQLIKVNPKAQFEFMGEVIKITSDDIFIKQIE